MIVLALFSWWYTAGWARQVKRAGERVELILSTFSVHLLLQTLFSPFRQISAENVQGPLAVQMRAFGDRLFSRVFGCIIRGLFILIGVLGAGAVAVLSLLQLVIWPLVPILPLVGLILMAMGWTF